MKHIYGNSALTIVAASASDVFGSLFHPRAYNEPIHQIPIRIRPGTFGTVYVNELDAACYDERSESIAKRAWTIQEQLLAQRTLTFTSRTMMLGCYAGVRNYGNSLYIPFDVDSSHNDNDDKCSLNLSILTLTEDEAIAQKDKALSCWLRLVTAYSLRSASDSRDKLNALAGVASRCSFYQALDPGYYAEMWAYKIARQLTWCVSTRHRTLPENETFVISRPKMYRAPSWSWASLEGGVVHFDFSYCDEDESEDEDEPCIICDILHCSTSLLNAQVNPLGEITNARLTIRATARWAWFTPSSSNFPMIPDSPIHFSLLDSVPQGIGVITLEEAEARHADTFRLRFAGNNLAEYSDAEFDPRYLNMCGTCDETVLCDPLVVLCAAINCHEERKDGVEGILLVPASKGVDEKGAFRRVGHFEPGYNMDFAVNAKVEITTV